VYWLSGKNQFGYRLLVIGYQKKSLFLLFSPLKNTVLDI